MRGQRNEPTTMNEIPVFRVTQKWWLHGDSRVGKAWACVVSVSNKEFVVGWCWIEHLRRKNMKFIVTLLSLALSLSAPSHIYIYIYHIYLASYSRRKKKIQ